MPITVDWTDRDAVLHRVASLPRPTALAIALRAAERVLPTLSQATHPDTMERWNTLDAVPRVVKRHLQDGSVSKFTLRQARDLSYDVADIADSLAADAVLYVASAAVEADPTRSLVECLRAAVRAVPEQVADIECDCENDTGPIWAGTEPDWWAEARSKLDARKCGMPKVLELPEPTARPLDLDADARGLLADSDWIDDEYNRGCWAAYVGQYVAVASRKLLAHGTDPNRTRADAATASGLAPRRIAVAFIEHPDQL